MKYIAAKQAFDSESQLPDLLLHDLNIPESLFPHL